MVAVLDDGCVYLQTDEAYDQQPDELTCLKASSDSKGDILAIDETLDSLMEHIVPIHDEDMSRYMLIDKSSILDLRTLVRFGVVLQ